MSPHTPESVAPTRTDPVVAAASQIVGGPLGRYAALARHTGRTAWQPAAAVLVGLSSLTIALGVLQKAHCFTKGWSSPDQLLHACYSDLPILYQAANLGQTMPYLPGSKPLDQPVISGLVMWLVGLAVPDGSALVQQQWYFALWVVLITVMVMALVVVTVWSVPDSPWRAAHVALSPVLVLAGLLSVDLLGVLLTSVALLAWGRNKVVSAGFMLGLAIAARSYPLVILVAIGLLAVRSGRMRAWARLAGMALVTWFAVSLPWLLTSSDAVLLTYRTWWQSPAGYGSLWLVPALLGHDLSPAAVTGLAITGWLLAVLVGALFALSLNRRPTVAEISLVMLVVVLVTDKAVPVQATLWLLPLIALVGMKWAHHLIWALFEAIYFVAVWFYIAGLSNPERALPSGTYSVLLGLRLGAVVFLLVQVWRVARSRRPADAELRAAELRAAEVRAAELRAAELPDAEPSNADYLDADYLDAEQDEEVDPLAGPMAGAPDRVVLRFG
jgi:Glycosyltransferase family 87